MSAVAQYTNQAQHCSDRDNHNGTCMKHPRQHLRSMVGEAKLVGEVRINHALHLAVILKSRNILKAESIIEAHHRHDAVHSLLVVSTALTLVPVNLTPCIH